MKNQKQPKIKKIAKPAPLDIDAIKKACSSITPPLTLSYFPSIESSHVYAREHTRLPSCTLILADAQTGGIGTANRNWHSPANLNLYLTLIYEFDAIDISGLSLVCSLSIVKMLGHFNIKGQIKWPNDVLCDNKKIAGTLIDITTHGSKCRCIISTGININMTEQPTLGTPWTSMQLCAHKSFNRNDVALSFIHILMKDISAFNQQQLPLFMDTIDEYDFLKGKNIQLIYLGQTYKGYASGITDAGALLLTTEDGAQHTFMAGEAQLLLYPY